MRPLTAGLVVLTVLLMLVTFPHALEDFHYGDLTRLGVGTGLGVALLVSAYAAQLAGIALAVRNDRRGVLLLALLGSVWCAGAIAIHGHDLLFAGPGYRHGAISKALEALIIALGAGVAVLGLAAAKTLGPRERAPKL